MRTKTLHKAKIIVTVEGNNLTKKIKTIFAVDNRTGEALTDEYIKERGIEYFLNMDDMKETLNWNLNGDSSKFQFKWGQTVNGISEGRAYIYD